MTLVKKDEHREGREERKEEGGGFGGAAAAADTSCLRNQSMQIYSENLNKLSVWV